jgi:hypothetical protein
MVTDISNRPERKNFKTDQDYLNAWIAYGVDLEKYRDDPEQDERNKTILEGKVYVQKISEDTVVVGFPQPLKASIDISDAAKYKIYFIPSRLRELFDALVLYYNRETTQAMRLKRRSQ